MVIITTPDSQVQGAILGNEDKPKLLHEFKDPLKYDGAQLHSLFAYNVGKLQKDSIIAFIGPANVSAHMVDQEDVNAKDYIYSDEMVHFIVTLRGNDLEKAVIYQRLLMCIVKDSMSVTNFTYKDDCASLTVNIPVTRDGDDIFVADKKASVSIATISSNQKMLIHAGININPGASCPVKAAGLAFDLNYDKDKISDFVYKVIRGFCEEVDSIRKATFKVRSVN